MRTITLSMLAACTLLAACQKEQTRSVKYKAECGHCRLQYEEKGGAIATVDVYGKWEKTLTMEEGDRVSLAICGYNNPTGGNTSPLPPFNPAISWVFVDGFVTPTINASVSHPRKDSVEVSPNVYRRFYTDTCASAVGMVPAK